MLSIFYSDEFLDHDTGAYHPEKPGRLTAITTALKTAPWADQLDWRSPTPINAQNNRLMAALEAIHPQPYIAAVQQLAHRGGGYIDPDTIVSPRSYDVALLAVSAWLDGVDQALATGEPAFVLARPPGHHALPQRGMGFCIFANAAIAAHHALQQPGVNRVAILDWDVHHGNGTQRSPKTILKWLTAHSTSPPFTLALVRLKNRAFTTISSIYRCVEAALWQTTNPCLSKKSFRF